MTGALLICGDVFIQALEGDHASLQSLFRTIEADFRHRDVTLKGVEAIDKRMFARWGRREGRVPIGVAPMDISTLGYNDLRALLQLWVKSPLRKAA